MAWWCDWNGSEGILAGKIDSYPSPGTKQI